MTETAVPRTREKTIETYVRFWNAEFAGDQRRLASASFADDVEYHAPIGVLHAAESLIGFRNELARHLEAVEYRLREEPEVVRDRARLRWEVLVGNDHRESFAEGTDVLAFDERGRIASVVTFLDRSPEGFDPQTHHGRSQGPEGRW